MLLAAAIIGDVVDYLIGRCFGRRLPNKPRRFVRPEHIVRTEASCERHGGKTISLARFLLFNASGAALWVGLFVGGVCFGDIPWVKDDLTPVLIAVVLVFVAPGLEGVARRRLRGGGRDAAAAVPASASDVEPAGERPDVWAPAPDGTIVSSHER